MNGFKECLEVMLGDVLGTLPESDSDRSLMFWRQWLSERHLGLVQVAEPREFEWAGHWIGLVRGEGGELDAVLMFGVPSGIVLDPIGVSARGAPTAIEAGFVVAPLGASLLREPSGVGASLSGEVQAVLTAPEATVPLVRVPSARARPGRGLDGDRYAERRGTFGAGGGNGYDLTLIEAEALEDLASLDVELSWEEARRNVVTRGIDLNALVGRRFLVGDVECVGRRLAEPCAHLERLTRTGVLRALIHRGGLRADVVGEGVLAVGDAVRALD
ncbi:MAG: MOSC domain-containing protein [Gaiellaceae bacterium]